MAKDADAAECEVTAPDSVAADPDEVGRDNLDGVDEAVDAPSTHPTPAVRPALILGTLIVLALGVLAGWQGFRAERSGHAQRQRDSVVAVARQGAINLTTISYTEAEADVKRILDGATGAFRDDFGRRSQPFVDVVKQAQSKSEGTVTAAALESFGGNESQVLVAVTVKTLTAAAPDPQRRSWRMRISVQGSGEAAKVSNVEFVP